jgi:hypothetical protein
MAGGEKETKLHEKRDMIQAQGGSKVVHQLLRRTLESELWKRKAQSLTSSRQRAAVMGSGSSIPLKTKALRRFQMFQAMAVLIVACSEEWW